MSNGADLTQNDNIPKEVKDYYEKGIAAVKRENYDYAVELFGAALALKQDLAEARYFLWFALWEKQKKTPDPLKIRVIFSKISALFPTLKGFSLQKRGRNWEAIYQLEKAMKLDPCNTKTLSAMAECLLSEGQTFNAIKILEGIPMIDKKNYKALEKLGQLYKSIDNYDKARAYYEATLRVNPNDIEAERAIKDLDALKTLKGSFANPQQNQ
jgi:tetratricopeptide (TPR) repeat protein